MARASRLCLLTGLATGYVVMIPTSVIAARDSFVIGSLFWGSTKKTMPKAQHCGSHLLAAVPNHRRRRHIRQDTQQRNTNKNRRSIFSHVRKRQGITRQIQKHSSAVLSGIGFVSSSATALWPTTASLDDVADDARTTTLVKEEEEGGGEETTTSRWYYAGLKRLSRLTGRKIPPTLLEVARQLEAVQDFLQSSGVDTELAVNFRVVNNALMLAQAQNRLLVEGVDRRDNARLSKVSANVVPSKAEAIRFMRYSTAAYGDRMVGAADLDARGRLDRRKVMFKLRAPACTKACISKHVGVAQDDIVLMNLDHSSIHVAENNNATALSVPRHFVAVDHKHRQIILAIRGTYSVSEFFSCICAFTRPFCGGEAHSEMAGMAERLWNLVSGTLQRLLCEEYPGYELILTGHSLGAGVACLLNVWLHSNATKMISDSPIRSQANISWVSSHRIPVRCFAFAAPPCFAGEAPPTAIKHCFQFLHGNDFAPFLSVASVRQLFAALRDIDNELAAAGGEQLWTKLRFLLSKSEPDDLYADIMLQAVQRAYDNPPSPKERAPILLVPAQSALWFQEQIHGTQRKHHRETREYSGEVCDVRKLAGLPLLLHPTMMLDHLPCRYERALENFACQDLAIR